MLRSVVIGWTLMETSITAVARIKEFEQTTPRENDSNSDGVIIREPDSGRIEYKNLTVSYGLSNENLALKNVNLVIEAGQKVGICGRSGRIVVLDEVTSSLDLETEQLIWGVLQEEFRGCTIIAVAHRLETIVGFDRVAVMDEGNIIEFDDPRVLLEDANSAFSKMRRTGKAH
ncbi:ABC transporter C family member 13 [Colletotrichum sp. SAR11_57]|nr:ABC transporter C family member 13 [Colletotrichum sp. SAR11_57]